jgi:hypothetical protein
MASFPEGVNIGSLTRTLQEGETPDRIEAARTLSIFGALAVEAIPVLVETPQDEIGNFVGSPSPNSYEKKNR